MEFEQVLMLLGVILVVALILALLAIIAFGLRIHIVPEDQRYIIYWLGRFARVAGPGLVLVIHRFETIGQVMDVREQPAALRVEELQFNGVFLGYTFNFWYTNDPVAAAGSNHERLAQLVQFDDNARRMQMDTKLRETVMESINAVQSALDTPEDAGLIERLIPVLPGQPASAQLAEELKARLQPALFSIGIVLSQRHPVNISRIHLSPMLMDNFGRGITLSMLKDQMPDAPADTLAQLLSSIEGREMPNIRKVVVERPIERSTSTADRGQKPMPPLNEAKPDSAEAASQKRNPHSDDWRVLKSMPRRSRVA